MVSLLESEEVNSSSVAAYVVHKPFMAVAKYCDLVLEPSFRLGGVDFYRDGFNIATANLLTTLMPIYLGDAPWQGFLRRFVKVIRERTHTGLADLRQSAELFINYLHETQPRLANLLVPLMVLRDPDRLFSGLNQSELDPIATAYHEIVNRWSITLGRRFELLADESKVLLREGPKLLALSGEDLVPFSAGYDRRRQEFPMKLSRIENVDSRDHKQVQLADVIGGAIQRALRTDVGQAAGTFGKQIVRTAFSKELIIGGLWPGQEITPEELETDGLSSPGDVDLATYTARILKGDPATRRTPSA